MPQTSPSDLFLLSSSLLSLPFLERFLPQVGLGLFLYHNLYLFYHTYIFNSQKICAREGSIRDGKKLAEEWICIGRNFLPLMTCLEMRNSLRSSGPLGENLLLPSWFMEDFEEESSESLLGIFVWDSLGKNLLLPY